MTVTPAASALPSDVSDGASASGPRPSVILLLCGYFALFALALIFTPSHGPRFALFNDIAYLPFRATAALLLYQAAKASRNAEISRSWRLMFLGQ